MKPLIGIPLCLDDRGRWRPGRNYLYTDCAYARAVDEAGGVPLHIPIRTDPVAPIARIDGLVLPGGDDLLPDAPYPSEVEFDPAPDEQLTFDRALLAAAIDRRLPVLGICYGMQLMGMRDGGRLHHHLPIDLPDARDHKLPEQQGRHALDVRTGTILAECLGSAPAPVNSLHHQAIATPGADLVVSAHSPDGVIEAIEARAGAPGLPGFYLGVQWHPEKLPRGSRGRLFEALVAACRPAGLP